MPIAQLASDYPDKFGVPRQPGLVPSARAVASLLSPYDDPLAVAGLDDCSHIWLSFIFDRSPATWRPRVRPPRLGGNRRVGVFATRSTHRPNRLGQSVVRLLDVATSPRPVPSPWPIAGAGAALASRTHLLIGGHDLVDGTPIVDIKPYLPWAESLPDARAGLAPTEPERLSVAYEDEARAWLDTCADGTALAALISEVLSQDPRPAYRAHDSGQRYGVALRNVDVGFCIDARGGVPVVRVLDVRYRSASGSAAQPPI